MLLGVLALGLGLAGQAVPLRKAVALTSASLYLNPDTTSTQVGAVQPGMGIALQSQVGDFAQVFVGAIGVSGWMPNHNYAPLDDPASAEAIFGAAVGLEIEAEDNGGERRAALDAANLFMTVYTDFPASPRAPEALYRAASIRWQLKMAEEPRRPSPSERQFPDDSEMHRVINKYGKTPWAARAEYDLLVEHFTCGVWVEKPECVEKEIHTYQGYVKKYPGGPKTAEAAYDALYRAGIAWTLYRAPGKHHDAGKAAQYQQQVAEDAATIARLYPASDWAAQAALIAFNVAHGTALKLPGHTPLGGP
ncbi:MAG TPA: hypothetical protein VMV31_15145 [Terriglobales bacterium]|nr:hypothetical protein [Terriglobales bacterium]